MAIAWEIFFLGGAMSTVRGYFEEWLGFKSGRDLQVQTQKYLNESTNVVGYQPTKLQKLMNLRDQTKVNAQIYVEIRTEK